MLHLKGVEVMLDKIALIILIIGGLNWGAIGLFNFDCVAWIFGGALSIGSRIVYILVAVAALWCIRLLFSDDEGKTIRTK